MATGLPMAGWGFAWILGLGALDLLEGAPRIIVAVLAWAIGMALSWLPLRAAIRTGSETRMRWAWLIVLVTSPFLVAAAQPATFENGVLFGGALWGLAMCLYAIATGDRVLAAVSGFGVIVAGLFGYVDLPTRLLWFGVAAGVPLLVLGISRVVREAGRE